MPPSREPLRERGLPTIVVRLFNTVGPRQTGSYGMVVPRLVGQALAGEPLTVYGDGHQTRCFCHVADVVQALFGPVPCGSPAVPVRPGSAGVLSYGSLSALLAVGLLRPSSACSIAQYSIV
jgi:UDP-glucose 4-epimerase